MNKRKWKAAAKFWEEVARKHEATIIAYPNDRKKFAEQHAANVQTELEQSQNIREAIADQLSNMCEVHDSVLLRLERLQREHTQLQEAYELLDTKHMHAQKDANEA
jgi:hypothetical protein